MSEHTFIVAAALCRLAALVVVLYSSVKHRDWIGLSIGLLWSVALFANTWTTWKSFGAAIATPLVYLVCWGIIKRHRLSN